MRYFPKRLDKGEIEEGILILFALCIIIFVFLLPGRGANPTSSLSSFGTNGGQTWQTGGNSGNSRESNLSLGTGNAGYEYQSYAEYITLDNRGGSPVNITGYKLKNAKGDKSYQIGTNLQTFGSDIAEIPQGALYIAPNGANLLTDIVLKDGDTAVLTTGTIGATAPYAITSFKENMCSGYLQTKGDYTFTPTLDLNCLSASKEPGFNNLDQSCQNFISGFPSCHTPELNGLDRNRDACNGCVDGRSGLSNQCLAFIKNHFNYSSCVLNHATDPDFSGRTWRIYLGQSWELWAKDHETISLLDRLGNLIDSRSY